MTRITLLDGSIGQELVKRSGDQPTPLWSTQVMIDRPQLVRQVHDAYFTAGATVATTNTYAVLDDRLAMVPALQGHMAPLMQAATAAACAARDAHGGGRVAGAVGPLAATYRPELCPPPDEAAITYAKPLSHLKDRVDLILFETMASVMQAEGALRAAANIDLPVWLSVTVDDDTGHLLRSGEPVTDLAPLIAKHRPDAILVNCSRPEAITAALEDIATFGIPFGAYANGFTAISTAFLDAAPTVDVLTQRTDLGPEAYADFAMRWVDQGATIVGGCCEVGPGHIAELATRLRDAGHEIV